MCIILPDRLKKLLDTKHDWKDKISNKKDKLKIKEYLLFWSDNVKDNRKKFNNFIKWCDIKKYEHYNISNHFKNKETNYDYGYNMYLIKINKKVLVLKIDYNFRKCIIG